MPRAEYAPAPCTAELAFSSGVHVSLTRPPSAVASHNARYASAHSCAHETCHPTYSHVLLPCCREGEAASGRLDFRELSLAPPATRLDYRLPLPQYSSTRAVAADADDKRTRSSRRTHSRMSTLPLTKTTTEKPMVMMMMTTWMRQTLSSPAPHSTASLRLPIVDCHAAAHDERVAARANAHAAAPVRHATARGQSTRSSPFALHDSATERPVPSVPVPHLECHCRHCCDDLHRCRNDEDGEDEDNFDQGCPCERLHAPYMSASRVCGPTHSSPTGARRRPSR